MASECGVYMLPNQSVVPVSDIKELSGFLGGEGCTIYSEIIFIKTYASTKFAYYMTSWQFTTFLKTFHFLKNHPTYK